MHTKEEIEKMTPEEKKVSFRSDLDELIREETKKCNSRVTTLTDKVEEKIYQDGKVVAMGRSNRNSL